MNPVNATIPSFDASAGLWIVLHDLTGPDFSININLPKYYFPVPRGTQHIVVGRFSNLQIGKMFAEESDEIGVEGE